VCSKADWNPVRGGSGALGRGALEPEAVGAGTGGGAGAGVGTCGGVGVGLDMTLPGVGED
jgi:hypothetical protein